jgi:hypothetical protein
MTLEVVKPISEETVGEKRRHIENHLNTFVKGVTVPGQVELMGLHFFASAIAFYQKELEQLSPFPAEMSYGQALNILITERSGRRSNGQHPGVEAAD